MSRSVFAVKEARVRPTRQQVNLCGSCGKEISATELLCRGCRGTMGRLDLAIGGVPTNPKLLPGALRPWKS